MAYPNLGPRGMSNPAVALKRPLAQDIRDALVKKLTMKQPMPKKVSMK